MGLDTGKSLVKKLVFSSALFAASASQAQNTLAKVVEVPLENVFIAARGFDDNDPIQVVVEGLRPNLCYALSDFVYAADANDPSRIRLTQNAILSESGDCDPTKELPPALSQPKYFWKEVVIGHLPARDKYSLEYLTKAGLKTREFSVSIAPTDSVDSLKYAMVENAFVKDDVLKTEETFEIKITGFLNSSCAEVDRDVAVLKIDDVYVALLQVDVKPEICLPVNKPFFKTLKIPVPEKVGRYMLHVRAMGGEAKNKIFSVK
jgi:hypothetical protein